MRTRWFTTLLAVCLALPALAQGPPDRSGWRGGYGPRPEPGPRFLSERFFDRVARELDLDEHQRVQLDAIAADFRQHLVETVPPHGQMRELWQQMREARESGDEARVDELRQQMQELRSGSQHMMDRFLDEIETILRPDQAERLAQFRVRRIEPMRHRDRGAFLRGMMQTLPDDLALDEAQRAQFDDLLADFHAQREGRRQRWQELWPLMQDLREATRIGDEAWAEEIREQLEAARAEAGNPFDYFFAQLEQILRDDQKARLAELHESYGPPESRRAATETLDVRNVLQAARRLDLDAAQRETLRDITQEAMRGQRDLSRRDREAQAELARKVKNQIAALLTPEQKAQFERILQDQRPRRDMRERPRGERPRGEPERGRRGRDWDAP